MADIFVYYDNREALHQESTGRIVLLNAAVGCGGSDAGANIEEGVSWGKVKSENTCVKIFGMLPGLAFQNVQKGSER